MADFRYDPLQRREIRLLQLLPAESSSSPLECNLVHVTLDRCTVLDSFFAYDALSYVWGGERCKPITCNGRSLAVSLNLYNALRSIRTYKLNEPFFHHTLWVDAVCINQDDHVERGHQVRLMKEIYHSARCVLVWLGNFRYTPIPFSEQVGARLGIETSIQVHRRYIAESLSTRFELLNQPWFERIWVIQEAIVAKAIKVLSGGMELSWDDLVSAANHVHGTMNRNISGEMENALASCRVIMNIDSLRQKLSASNQDSVPSTVSIHGGPQDLYELVEAYRSQRSSDPRDKVYALLGIAMELQSDSYAARVDPDYSMAPEHVFIALARMVLTGYQPLRLLRTIDGRVERTLQLPSWVPDWSVSIKHQPLSTLCDGEYCLHRQYRAMVYKHPNERILRLCGKIVGTIFVVSDILHPTEIHLNSDRINQWRALSGKFPLLRSPEMTETAFWKTLIARLTGSYLGSPAIIVSNYRRFKDVSVGRRFIVTKRNHYGIAPPDTMTGDRVVVFPGSPLPFVVGRQELGASSVDILKGEIFVQDINLNDIMENKRVKLKEFLLY